MPSAVIKKIEYDYNRLVLRVFYRSGSIYDYLKVPPEVYEAMCNAFSKGTFLNRQIKERYTFKKVH